MTENIERGDVPKVLPCIFNTSIQFIFLAATLRLLFQKPFWALHLI